MYFVNYKVDFLLLNQQENMINEHFILFSLIVFVYACVSNVYIFGQSEKSKFVLQLLNLK